MWRSGIEILVARHSPDLDLTDQKILLDMSVVRVEVDCDQKFPSIKYFLDSLKSDAPKSCLAA